MVAVQVLIVVPRGCVDAIGDSHEVARGIVGVGDRFACGVGDADDAAALVAGNGDLLDDLVCGVVSRDGAEAALELLPEFIGDPLNRD